MKHQYSEAFERFCKAYPRPKCCPKWKAWEEWQKTLKQELTTEEVMIAAAAQYRRDLANPKLWNGNPPPAAHMRTWLHQRRWMDFAEQQMMEPTGAFVMVQPGTEQWRAWCKEMGKPPTWRWPLAVPSEWPPCVQLVPHETSEGGAV